MVKCSAINCGSAHPRRRRRRCAQGFSLVELLIVMLIMGIVGAMALPSAITAVKNYRLHADATALASYLNLVRMRAASQYAPYRLVMNDSSVGGTNTYGMEKLCGYTPSTADSNCTDTVGPPLIPAAYKPFTTRQFEVGVGGSTMGAQPLAQGNTLYGCRLTGVSIPPLSTISGDLSTSTPPCSNTSMYFYFNTRGLPVDSSGNILSNGGNVVYLQSAQGLLDAVTVSSGGRVTIWGWSPGSSTWAMR